MIDLALSVSKAIIRNKRGKSSYPSFGTFLVTWRCNAKCIMCSIWEQKKSAELSLDAIDTIFSQLKHLDAIRLTGGEPFLREDLPEIVNIIEKRVNPSILHITTNGFLTDRLLKLVNQAKHPEKIHIKISINGIGEKHDKVMGIPGAFDKAIKSLEALGELKKTRKFYLGVNHTVTDEQGYQDYLKLKEIGKKYGVKPHVVFAYKEVDLYKSSESSQEASEEQIQFDPFFNYNKEELAKFLQVILKDSKHLGFIESLVKKYYIEGLYNRLIKNDYTYDLQCVALNNHLRILPNGDVPICLYFSDIAGNLTKESFEQVWFGEKIKPLREKVRTCPGCWAECEVTPNAVYTGKIIPFILHSFFKKSSLE